MSNTNETNTSGSATTAERERTESVREILAQPDLGEVSDRIIAHRVGCTVGRVAHVRYKNDIKSTYATKHKPPPPIPNWRNSLMNRRWT